MSRGKNNYSNRREEIILPYLCKFDRFLVFFYSLIPFSKGAGGLVKTSNIVEAKELMKYKNIPYLENEILELG